MAIRFNNEKNNNSITIKNNEGFTFILTDNTEGFGFICLTENNDIVVTVTVIYNNDEINQFSSIIKKTDDINLSTPIKSFLENAFGYDVKFIKAYKKLNDMNIIVDLEAE